MHTVHTRGAHTFPVPPGPDPPERTRMLHVSMCAVHTSAARGHGPHFSNLVTFNSLLFYHTHHD